MAIVSSVRKMNRTRLNLFLDLALVLIFVVELEEHFIGIRNHELLGLAFGAALLLHIVLHWQWVVGVTKVFFHDVLHGSRLNYVLNLALLIDAVVMVVTGIVISRTLGLDLGIETHGAFPWERVHILSAELSLLLVGLHVAIHWQWIANNIKKIRFRFRLPLRNGQGNRTVIPGSATNVPTEA